MVDSVEEDVCGISHIVELETEILGFIIIKMETVHVKTHRRVSTSVVDHVPWDCVASIVGLGKHKAADGRGHNVNKVGEVALQLVVRAKEVLVSPVNA